MSGPGTVQLFSFYTLSWMSASVMTPGSFCGRMLCSICRSTIPWALVLCVPSFSQMQFQYCSVSALGRSAVTLRPYHWEQTLDGLLENILFILMVSTSLLYLFRWVSRALNLCSFASAIRQFTVFLGQLFHNDYLCISVRRLTSLHVAMNFASSCLFHGGC